LSNLEPGQDYYWKVFAYDKHGALTKSHTDLEHGWKFTTQNTNLFAQWQNESGITVENTQLPSCTKVYLKIKVNGYAANTLFDLIVKERDQFILKADDYVTTIPVTINSSGEATGVWITDFSYKATKSAKTEDLPDYDKNPDFFFEVHLSGNTKSLGQSGYIEVIDNKSPQLPTPQLPTAKQIINTSTIYKDVVFSWSQSIVSDCESAIKDYKIEVSNDAAFGYLVESNITANLSKTFSLTPGTYYWRVAARNVAGYPEDWKNANWTLPIEFTIKYSGAAEILKIEHDGTPLGERKSLLLVHGWQTYGMPADYGGGIWEEFKTFFANDKDSPDYGLDLKKTYKIYTVQYLSNLVSIAELGNLFRAKVNDLNLNHISIVAHSMGGLVSRAFMASSLNNINGGELVDKLITLGTPHHGSPMANGTVLSTVDPLIMPIVNQFDYYYFTLTNGPKFYQHNRTDLHWDNYDHLFNFNVLTQGEINNWLVNLNSNTTFDNKIILYGANWNGVSNIGDNLGYAAGFLAMKELGLLRLNNRMSVNDGIVPISSAHFDGHNVKAKRTFYNYNHTRIARGINGASDELFTIYLKSDLAEANISSLVIAPSESVIFANTPVNTESLQILTLNNSGSTDISITNITVAGTDKNEFRTVSSLNLPLTLKPGESREIIIGFKPISTGIKEAVLTIINNSDNAPNKLVNLKGTGNGTPEITVIPNLLMFDPEAVGSSSAPKSYTVSGKNLTGSITINAPAGFQISTNSSSGFGSQVTLQQNSGVVNLTTIYARFSPTAAMVYSGNITHTSIGAETKNVSVSGTGAGAPEMTVFPNSLKFDPLPIGSSTVKSYTFSAKNLTGSVTIAAPQGFQISLNSIVGSTNYVNSITLSPSSGNIINTTIYVKFSPNAAVAYSGNITHTSLGAKTENVWLSGSGAGAPEITVSTATLTSFGDILVGSNSTTKSYTVSGKNLSGSITINAPAGFQISTNSSSGFTSSVTLPQNVGVVNLTTIYARFSPVAAVAYSGNITHTSPGAETKNVSVSGKGIPTESSILSIGTVNGSPGSKLSVPVTATNLKDISGFQFTIEYDKNKLSFENYSNWATGITGVEVGNPEGKITCVFADPNAKINILNGKLFDINFIIKESITGTAELIWSDNPLKRSIVKSDLTEIACTYINGSVTIAGYKLSGIFTYDNTDKTPLVNQSITLNNSSGQSAGNNASDVTGNFSFTGLSNGTYTLKPLLTLPWGNSGVNVTDVLMYKQFIAKSRTLSSFRERAGDVNGSGLPINVTDVLLIMRRLGDPSKTFTAGDWLYDNTTAVINNADISGHNILGLCYGDANGSFIPTTNKSASNIFAAGKDIVKMLPNNELEVPFRIDRTIGNLAAVGLTFSYPEDIFDVREIRMADRNEDLYYTVIDGKIRIVFATLNAFDQDSKSPLFTIKFKVNENANLIAFDNARPVFSGFGDFADVSATEYQNVNMIYAGIDNDLIEKLIKDKEVKIYPNPARNFVNITNVENSEISVSDIHGRMVMKVIGNSNLFWLDLDGLKTGVYLISVKKDQYIVNEKITVIK
jgi:hypothetical protein